MKITRCLCFVLMIAVLLPTCLTGCFGIGEDAPEGTTADQTSEVTTEVSKKPADPEQLSIAETGMINYYILYPSDSVIDLSAYVFSVQEAVYNVVGKRPQFFKEGEKIGDSYRDFHVIHIGKTTTDVGTAVYEDLSYGSYSYGNWGEDLYIAAYSISGYTKAVEGFCGVLNKAGVSTTKTIVTSPFGKTVSFLSGMDALPKYEKASQVGVVGVGSSSYELILGNELNPTDFTTYCEMLEGAGYEKNAENIIGNVKFATYVNDNYAAYVDYHSNRVRVTMEPKTTAFLPSSEPVTYTKPTGVICTESYLCGVGYSSAQNGMLMIYLLADGTFVIYDAGGTTADGRHIYTILSKIAQNHGLTKIEISAWIITHAHGDHIGGLGAFLKYYVLTNEVTIQKFFINFTNKDEQGDASNYSAENNILTAIGNYASKVPIYRLHAGQKFYLADVQFEILYTLDELDPAKYYEGNEASLVMRLKIDGKTVLMTGDACTGVWNLLVKIYGNNLKVDYLQAPHHGTWYGGTVAAYDCIKPEYIWFPCGDNLFHTSQASSTGGISGIMNHLLTNYGNKNNYWVAGVYDGTTGRVTKTIIKTGTVTVYSW